MTGLRLDDITSPYTDGLTSRWIRVPGFCDAYGYATVENQTATTIVMGLRTNSLNMSDERNPNVHDIKVRDYIDSGSSGVCSEDASTIRGSVDLDGDFWQHVHPDELNVYDFSGFMLVLRGIGSREAGPIRRWAEDDGVHLAYPSNHVMSRWETIFGIEVDFESLGRLNDTVDFATLPVVRK